MSSLENRSAHLPHVPVFASDTDITADFCGLQANVGSSSRSRECYKMHHPAQLISVDPIG